ncbi:transcriptional regulator [Frateuria aurantia DSM 6220]|uniref:Transcriptional regulator n=2 Tax=Frateuria aurantia TaxID=81475 RepID=H8KZD4_FRAAD|nr:transcriptional regulator [Frateuria aurantia DSM 6220]
MNNTNLSSQKSSEAVDVMRAPKRQRGKERVAALLEAAGRLFAAKGYPGTTMTEIAAEAGASIGSLYQFFPSKPAIAAALLQRYLEQLHAGLDQVSGQLDTLDAVGLAEALLNLMLALMPDRHLALLMLEGTDDAIRMREQWRSELRSRLAQLLRTWCLVDDTDSHQAHAVVLLQLLKTVPVLADEFGRQSPEMSELQQAVTCYLQGMRVV